jgi:Phage late-transcription coactivator
MSLSANNSESFAKHIERMVHDQKMTYIEAVLDFCEKRRLEPEAVVPYLSTKMKTAMAKEGVDLHLLHPRRELPLDD